MKTGKLDVNRTWSSFRRKRKELFLRQIRAQEEVIEDSKLRIKQSKRKMKKLQSELETVDIKVKEALRAHNAMIEAGKVKPNGNTTNALLNRDLCHVVGMCGAYTTLTYTSENVSPWQEYWIDKWFLDLQQKAGSNYDLYGRLEKLKKVQNHEEIEAYIGLMFLEVS